MSQLHHSPHVITRGKNKRAVVKRTKSHLLIFMYGHILTATETVGIVVVPVSLGLEDLSVLVTNPVPTLNIV